MGSSLPGYKAVLHDLRDAGMASPQAEVVALHIPDWKQFATGQEIKEVKQEIKEVKQELKQEIKTLRWFMVAGLILLSALSDRAAALFEYVMQFL